MDAGQRGQQRIRQAAVLPVSVRSCMLRRLQALRKDNRGSYELLQFALILPIFVVILYGSFELTKLISIRQSLDAGTYQAARYLSVYHTSYAHPERVKPRPGDDTLRALRLIWESLQANSYLTGDPAVRLSVRYFNALGQEIRSPADLNCSDMESALARQETNGLIFTVRAELTLPWRASVLGISL
ncbi:MAG: pilus assembly protein, partial [Chloroflexi bacterium]|nr:pilus assembly protein [Chloroflexota bacterium]